MAKLADLKVQIPFCEDPERRTRLESDDTQWLRHYFHELFWYPFTTQQLEMIDAIRMRSCTAATRRSRRRAAKARRRSSSGRCSSTRWLGNPVHRPGTQAGGTDCTLSTFSQLTSCQAAVVGSQV
jgi:hypothetical protein